MTIDNIEGIITQKNIKKIRIDLDDIIGVTSDGYALILVGSISSNGKDTDIIVEIGLAGIDYAVETAAYLRKMLDTAITKLEMLGMIPDEEEEVDREKHGEPTGDEEEDNAEDIDGLLRP